MLVIEVGSDDEFFDEETEEFLSGSKRKLRFEHSLFTISKWESKWKIPFLSAKEKTEEQAYDYIRCMALDDVDDLFPMLSMENLQLINDYIKDPCTATTVNDRSPKRRSEQGILTAEVIYVEMFMRQFPIECEHWHLNRLLMALQVWDAFNSGPNNKMSKKQTAAYYRQQNAANRARYHTKG